MNQLTLVALFAVAFGVALSNAETDCQRQKRNNSGTGPLQWDIQCDANGDYLPLQCTRQTPKWCACYTKQGLATQASRSIKSCECLVVKLAAENSDSGTTGCIPACERSGKFQKKQCCAKKCHCVDPTTGQKKTGSDGNSNVQCA